MVVIMMMMGDVDAFTNKLDHADDDDDGRYFLLLLPTVT